MSRQMWLLVGLVSVVVCVRIALFGEDINWDLRNYHYYGAWAFLNGVSFDNIWPAQVQTFINPLPYVPIYLAMEWLGPRITTIALAVLHATSIVLLVLLARQVLLPLIGGHEVHRYAGRLLVGSAVVIGVTASVFVGQIGTTLVDVSTSTLILGGLTLLIASRGSARAVLLVGLAGLVFGAAAGLKLTNGVYLVGALVTPWWLGLSRRDAARQFIVFVVAMGIGLLLTHGYWSLLLVEHFGSPTYPFYNTLFHSPDFPNFNVSDERYPAKSVFRGILFAFKWAIGETPGDAPSLDARFAIALTLIGLGVIAVLWRLRESWAGGTATLRTASWRSAVPPSTVPLLMLVPFFLASYFSWVFLFGVARYVVALELVSGVLIVGLLTLLVGRARAHGVAVLATIGLILFTTPIIWGRAPFGGDWFAVHVPVERQAANQLFVIVGEEPVAYVIPSFPRDSKFVRVDSYLGESALNPDMPVGQQIAAVIAAHDGPIYSIGDTKTSVARDRLAEFGLTMAPGTCSVINTKVDHIPSCPLAKL